MRRPLALLTAVVLLGACSGGEAEPPSSIGTTSATFSTSTVAPTTTTTKTPTTTTSTTPQSSTTANPLAPGGSGCTPGTATLPDGTWFGVVQTYEATGISFDLACWFTGEAAVAASAEDGAESPPPNDYYVRNDNTQLRPLSVDSDTPVTWYLSDPTDAVVATYADWTNYLDGQEFRNAVWVTIVNGTVTEIEEQWVP